MEVPPTSESPGTSGKGCGFFPLLPPTSSECGSVDSAVSSPGDKRFGDSESEALASSSPSDMPGSGGCESIALATSSSAIPGSGECEPKVVAMPSKPTLQLVPAPSEVIRELAEEKGVLLSLATFPLWAESGCPLPASSPLIGAESVESMASEASVPMVATIELGTLSPERGALEETVLLLPEGAWELD